MKTPLAVGVGAGAFLLLGACGGGREPLHPATDGAASCVPLVARIEKFEREDQPVDGESPTVSQIMQQELALFDRTARDITAIPSTDEAIQSFEQRYALFLHGRAAYLVRIGPFLLTLSSQAAAVQKSHAEEEAAAARCGNRTCSEFAAAHRQVGKEALGFLLVKAALIADTEAPENAKTDKALAEQGDHLNEDLRDLCGRPIPPAQKAK